MNKIIDALKLAEEALRMISTFQEEDNQCDNGYGAAYVANEALAAIRKSLAEPVKQEPVAIVDEIGKRLDGTNIFNAVGKVDVGQPLYAAPVDAKAIRAEAYKNWNPDVTSNEDGTFSLELPDGDEIRIIPPERQWVDLTNDEMWNVFISKDWTGEPLHLMCAVIAAFKEKNNG